MLGNIRIAQGLRSIPLKTHLAPLIIGVGALAIAVVGAFVVGGESATSGINSFVGRLSGSSGSSIRGIAPAAFGFAFVAGMVAAVNPCGCAMLPAYLGLYLGAQDGTQGGQNIALQLGKALIIGLVVTAGFLLLFGAVGLHVVLAKWTSTRSGASSNSYSSMDGWPAGHTVACSPVTSI